MRSSAVLVILSAMVAGCATDVAPDISPAAVVPQLLLHCSSGGVPEACDVELARGGVNEYSVAINPLDAENAIITANDYTADENPVRVNGLWGSYWVTHNGGASWEKHTLRGTFPDIQSNIGTYSFAGDLVVTFGPDGTAYIAGIAYQSVASTIYRNALFLTRSTDGGRSFSDPALVDSHPTEFVFHDKPAIAVDDERIYLAWLIRDGPLGTRDDVKGIRFAVSQDGGATWAAQPLSTTDWGISASIALGPDGEVNVAWRSYEPYAIRFARSTDHGKTFGEVSLLRGLEPLPLTLPNTTYRAFVLPTLVRLPDGTLLCVVPDEGPGGDSDIYLMRSIDAGATWDGKRLNDDETSSAQFLPTLAASANGTVVASWLDRRDDADDAEYRLYVAVSSNGWNFTQMPVSARPSADERTTGATFIGDYIGAAILGDRVIVAWPHIVDNAGALHAAVLTLGG